MLQDPDRADTRLSLAAPYDSKQAVSARSDLDPGLKARLVAYLYNRLEVSANASWSRTLDLCRQRLAPPLPLQLLVADFGSPKYSREALDAEYPVEQGQPHVLTLAEVRLLVLSPSISRPR